MFGNSLKYLSVAILLIALKSNAIGQNFRFKSTTASASGTLEDYEVLVKLAVINEGETDSLSWRVINKKLPETWYITVCEVPGRCYLPGTEKSNFLAPKNEEITLDVGFYPGEIVGNGEISIEVFHPKFPDKKKVAVFYATALPNSLFRPSKPQIDFSIFPNPGKNERTITYYGDEKQAFLYNQQGKLIHTFGLIKGEQKVDFNMLQPQPYQLVIGKGSTKLVVE
jgi:hypothetical protein